MQGLSQVINLFYALGIYECKSCVQNIGEIDPRRGGQQVQHNSAKKVYKIDSGKN